MLGDWRLINLLQIICCCFHWKRRIASWILEMRDIRNFKTRSRGYCCVPIQVASLSVWIPFRRCSGRSMILISQQIFCLICLLLRYLRIESTLWCRTHSNVFIWVTWFWRRSIFFKHHLVVKNPRIYRFICKSMSTWPFYTLSRSWFQQILH